MNNIKFAKTKPTAIIPSKEEENAGYDIYACWENTSKSDRIIKPHQTKLIPTGIACALPIEYYFQVEERGSTGSKGIKKSAGVIDSGYRGEIFIAISNVNDRYVIFGDKESYLKEALEELKKWQTVDVKNMSKQEIIDMEEFLKTVYQEKYDTLSSQEKAELIVKTYNDIKNEDSTEQIKTNIENAIFYPETKAIAQLVLHKVDNLPIEEISYDELQKIPSKRGDGKLGSSNK